MKLFNEDIQLIHIDNNTNVTTALITHALIAARANYQYAKFYTNKWYITVSFHKDLSADVSHNIPDLTFSRELDRMQRSGMNINKYADFISRWLNKIRKSSYYNNL